MMMDTLHRMAEEPQEYKILTNNEDRVMCALQWVYENGIMDKVLLFDVRQKSPAKATEFIELGNRAFCRSSIKDSWSLYNTAALYALPNSKELARACANRSAAKFAWGVYDLCLKDIERALAIGYPDHLKAKLHIRQVKCLWGVHKKMCPEIKSAIAKAEEWIEKANKCDHKKLQNALNNINIPKILSGVRLLNCYASASAHFIPETPTDNPRISRASKSIELKYSEEFGRHLAAVQDINAGQVLFFDQSFALISAFKSTKREFLKNFCWNCSNICSFDISCAQCVNMTYCTEECRDEDWNNYHQLDCPIINQLVSGCAKPDLFLALRMAMKAFKEASEDFQELKNKICKIDSVTDPIEKLLEGNVLDSSKYASVYSLASDNQPSFDQAVQAAIVLMILSRNPKIFGSAMKDVNEIIDHKWTAFMGSLILKNLQIINAVCYKQMLEPPADEIIACVGHAIQPLVALCNHSCDANTGIFFHCNIFVAIALQKIPSGQQIVVSYDKIDFQEESKIVRRKRLREEYKFCCTCTACTNDWKILTMKSYKELLPQRKVEQLQALIYKLNGLDHLITSRTIVAQQIALLKNILNTFDVTTQSPCREFFHFKNMLKDLYTMESI